MEYIEYLFYLSAEEDRLRVEFYKKRNLILEFVVQYEANISGKWHPVARYDTRHGFAHRDLLHPKSRIEKEPLGWQDYNSALTYATEDLKQNWQKYRHKYEEELNDKK
jgi:hypothetical protein